MFTIDLLGDVVKRFIKRNLGEQGSNIIGYRYFMFFKGLFFYTRREACSILDGIFIFRERL